MLSAEDIQNIIRQNFQILFQNSFPQLINTDIGIPIPVFNQLKEQKYWFVPLLLKSKVRGSAILDINGKIVSQGVLTPNVQDENKLIDKNYFETVPEKMLNEIKNFYPEYEISSPFLSFDMTPQKWGWLICLKKGDGGNRVNVYAGPEGWYEKKIRTDFEG